MHAHKRGNDYRRLNMDLKCNYPHVLRVMILLCSSAALALVLLGRDILMVALCVIIGALLLVLSAPWRVPQ